MLAIYSFPTYVQRAVLSDVSKSCVDWSWKVIKKINKWLLQFTFDV